MIVTANRTEEGWDLSPLQTPRETPLVVPFEKLARAVVAEWKLVEKAPKLGQIPITCYVNTALDLTKPDPAKAVAEVLAYLPTDLLVMRAPMPTELAEEEAKGWQPWLDWAEETHKIKLTPHRRLEPIAVPAESEAAMRARLEAMDIFRLTAVTVAAGLYGSGILALAVGEGVLTATDALKPAFLEEDYQNAKWGTPDEQVERRRSVSAEAETLEEFLGLLT